MEYKYYFEDGKYMEFNIHNGYMFTPFKINLSKNERSLKEKENHG